MRDTIKHFMWGYQQQFRHSVEREAARVLGSLKPGLNVRAFLIGVRFRDSEHPLPACVEPELHHWAQSSDFYDVLDDVAAIRDTYPEAQLRHSHPVAQDRHVETLFLRALRDAVIRRLEALPSLPEDTRIFASFPVEREDFHLMTILTVTKSVFDEIPRVASSVVRIHELRSIQVPCSLAEAAIDEMLAKANGVVTQPDAGSGLWVLGSADQILREAGPRFFAGLLNRVDQDSLIVGMTAEVFDVVSRLALARYERADAEGCLVIAERSANIGAPVLELAAPLRLKEGRALRKLLELTDAEVVLRCNCENAFALVRTSNSDPHATPAAIRVRVFGRGKWVVSAGGADLMVMSDGLPSLPQPVVDEPALARDLRRLLPTMTEASAALFATIGGRLAECGHGSIVVITEAAPDEATRLGKDSLPVSPLALTPDDAKRLSQIDGALLCDPHGACHAVGVILDGIATASGNRGRGSRYNSVVRYVESNRSRTAAMVVSDDGGLDLLPAIRPPLSRRKLSAMLDELKRLALTPSDPPDRDREVDVMYWLEDHAFYLSEDQCADANQWVAICDERAYSGAAIRLSPRVLRANPAFDPDRDLF